MFYVDTLSAPYFMVLSRKTSSSSIFKAIEMKTFSVIQLRINGPNGESSNPVLGNGY